MSVASRNGDDKPSVKTPTRSGAAMTTWSSARATGSSVRKRIDPRRSALLSSAPMRRREKAERIQKILDALYPEPPIPLDHGDAYTLLVSVLLSAQTTDKRVNMVTPELFARAPTPAEMVQLSVDEILAIVRTCGLAPAKAKAIRALSEILVDEHGGEVPRDIEALERLPGVGHKTASVVMIQAFDIPAFPVDTHIHRLAERWGLSSGKNVERTEHDLKKVFAREDWARLHLQIIYFGREHCPALRHDLSTCAICSWAATRKRIADEARKKTARKKTARGANRRG